MSTPFALELEAGKLDMAITMADSTPSANIKSIRLRTEQVFLLCRSQPPACIQTIGKAFRSGGTESAAH